MAREQRDHRKPLLHPHRKENDPFVIPPAYHIERAGHHWLQVRDYDGHPFGYIVLQWQPGVRQWCHSHQYSRGENYDVTYYEYVGPCPQPAREEDLKELKRTLTGLDNESDRAESANTAMQVGPACWKFLRKLLEPMLP
jgi:hypothetical protein